MGISINSPTNPSHFKVSKIGKNIKNIKLDIRNKKELEKKITSFKPKFIFHLAAQSLVAISYQKPTFTWQTNVIGTLNILEAVRKLKNKCNLIIITSDKCYHNKETHYGYKETDVLGGKDPYSGSKASAEILIKSYINSFFLEKNKNIRITTARAGNVVGGGDWAKYRIFCSLWQTSFARTICPVPVTPTSKHPISMHWPLEVSNSRAPIRNRRFAVRLVCLSTLAAICLRMGQTGTTFR